MLLTEKILEDGKSKFGAWNQIQMQTLGLSWPLQHGWKRKVIGKDLPEAAISRFLALKNAHLKPGQQPKPKKKRKEPKWYRAWKEKQRLNAEMDYAIAKDD